MSVFVKLLHPLSLRTLILFGFALAVLPLVATLVSAVQVVEGLAESSQTMAYRVARLSQRNEMLRERLVDFERKAKRYLVLNDADSRAALDDAYRNFTEVLNGLLELNRDSGLTEQLDALAADGEAVYRQLTAKPPATPGKPNPGEKAHTRGAGQVASPEAWQVRMDKAEDLFSGLGGKVQELARAIAGAAEAEVRALGNQSQTVQQDILIRSSVLLLVSLALVSLLTFLIIRSIRQMDFAIRRLGAGDLVRPVRVRGPKDLEYLGERLDWLRSRLHALEEAKQQFMRHVSHELKTPLATIHEGTELLADEVVGELNTEQRDIAQILVSNTQKLDALIAELINYSQANARPSARRREKVDVRRLVESVIEDCQLRLRAKSISVRPSLRPVWVDGNPEQFRTIVDNLLSNAIKYSPGAGEIRISLRQTGGHMELEIEDDGPGIEPEERKQVFEPFFQGKAAKQGKVGGTGLGLAIVSECVAGHHGKVEALEPHPDKTGARIRVLIPCRQDD
jgi:two-component system sensor histidine kinase GlrK